MGFVLTTNRLPELERGLPQQIGRVVAKVARDMQADAQQRAPIDTGNLKGSADLTQPAPFTWRLTFTADYALYQELGTRRMRARPYMVPAWIAARYRLLQALRRVVL